MKPAKIIILLVVISAGVYSISTLIIGDKKNEIVKTDSVSLYLNKIPAPTGYVNDFEHDFTKSEIEGIDSLIKAVNVRKDVVIAVLTVNDSMAVKNLFDSISLRVFNKWGIGDDKKDNGILIIMSESLRALRIENGYGIVPRLSNEETKIILQGTIIPEFKTRNYYQGIVKGILEIERKLK